MSPQKTPANGQSSRRHILLIEQDTEKRQSLYDFLRQRNFSVYTARSAEMALTILEYEQPDCILFDPQLPDMDASQLIRKIRPLNPRVPILLLGSSPAAVLDTQARAAVESCLPMEGPDMRLLAEIECRMSNPLPAAPQPQAGTILLIDDEARMRVIMQDFLMLNGFTVVAAESGEAGLKHLEHQLPDAVLLDVRMPGMDGLVVLKKIREQQLAIPIIMVTHVDEETAREEAMRLGATGYITKPFNFDGLKQVLRKALSARAIP